MKSRILWLDDKLVNVEDAKINVLSPTSQFGLNVFEGIPCYWNENKKQLYAFRLDDHFERLLKSAKLLEISFKKDKKYLFDAFVKTIRANSYHENISVRQTLFVDGFGTWSSEEPVNMFISPIPKKMTSSEYNKDGLNCCVSSYRRIDESILSPRIKCGANYINSRYGQREALRNGYDTCIFLNSQGKVSEGPGSCLFIVKNGVLVTPLLTDSVLESITRKTILQLASYLNIPYEERTIDRTELLVCDEAFLCGSSMEITKIKSIDGHAIYGSGLSDKLHDIYLSVVKGELPEFMNWVTPIYEDD